MSPILDPVKEVAKDLIKSTCQLFIFKSQTSNVPIPHGCCVLLEYNGKYFCLSNAHVLADEYYAKAQFLVGEKKSSTIGGLYLTSRLPSSQKRKDDRFDIAIVRLNDETADLLKEAGYTFLGINSIKTGYIQNTRDELLVAGYPATRTKYGIENGKVEVKPLPFFFRTHAHLKTIKSKYTVNYHVFANYPRTKLYHSNKKGQVVGPKPHGLSGSGLWLLMLNEDGLYKPYLVGIMTEYEDNRALFVSTKIDFFIDIIRQKIDPSVPNFGSKVTLD